MTDPAWQQIEPLLRDHRTVVKEILWKPRSGSPYWRISGARSPRGREPSSANLMPRKADPPGRFDRVGMPPPPDATIAARGGLIGRDQRYCGRSVEREGVGRCYRSGRL